MEPIRKLRGFIRTNKHLLREVDKELQKLLDRWNIQPKAEEGDQGTRDKVQEMFFLALYPQGEKYLTELRKHMKDFASAENANNSTRDPASSSTAGTPRLSPVSPRNTSHAGGAFGAASASNRTNQSNSSEKGGDSAEKPMSVTGAGLMNLSAAEIQQMLVGSTTNHIPMVAGGLNTSKSNKTSSKESKDSSGKDTSKDSNPNTHNINQSSNQNLQSSAHKANTNLEDGTNTNHTNIGSRPTPSLGPRSQPLKISKELKIPLAGKTAQVVAAEIEGALFKAYNKVCGAPYKAQAKMLKHNMQDAENKYY